MKAYWITCLWLAAAMVSSRSAQASCECILEVEGAELAVHCYQTCGYEDTSYSQLAWKNVTECHARALKFAANLWDRLERDPGLRRLARQAPLTFGRVYGWSDTLGLEDWQAPPGLPPKAVDSLLAVFREIDRDSSATLFTLQLGVFQKRSRADALWRHLDDLRPSVTGDPDSRDATLTVDWRLSTCAYTARPNLFIRPTANRPGPWRVYYGLFIDRNDAARAARRLRGVGGLNVVVRNLPLTDELLQAAFDQWRISGLTDTQ